MSLHKLTAGDGYAYLTRQVASHDATDRGYDNLADYYAQKGESPGAWMGRGLVGLSEFPPGFPTEILTRPDAHGQILAAGQLVSEAQMVALFGEGRHPAADLLGERMANAGYQPDAILSATRLGTPYPIHAGATMFRRRVAGGFEAYNRGMGKPKTAAVPADVRARIRTNVAEAMFREEYGRAPMDDRERAGFLAQISRQPTTAVAGYDLTFSPVKSVSALWAIAPAEIAKTVEEAHRAAVADTLTWLENAAAYTRLGRAGVRQVDVRGLIAAAFEHRDSRAGDPDLHTHVAISNKVQTLDGRWRALDGRTLHQMIVAASERYNTRLEAHLVARLGVAFAPRPGGEAGKRPVRELIGMPLQLIQAWSARRRAIEVRRTELSARFQDEHGRPPSPVEAINLAQQATLETREAKHEARSLAEQRVSWRDQADTVLGGADKVDALVTTVLNPGAAQDTTISPAAIPDEAWVNQTAAQVVATVQATRATWREAHLRAETERAARSDAIPLALLDQAIDNVMERALSPVHSIRLDPIETLTADTVTPAVGERVTPPLTSVTPHGQGVTSQASARTPAAQTIAEPGVLRRRDGTSVYETAGSRLFTSAAILAAEQQLLAIAGQRGAPALSPAQVDVALLESTANGLELNPGQAQLVRDLTGSGARLQVALAPAGTGKTTAMKVLAQAWTGAGGTVLGLAPSAVAAAELRKALPGSHTDTLAKLTHVLATATRQSHKPRHQRRRATTPQWVQNISPSTLVVIDEAGMAGTLELADAVHALTTAGATVRLVGDDQQLAAIGAGGILRDIAAEHGAATLTHVVRFDDPAEGVASLALRSGDASAIGFYLDNGRIHVGDNSTAADQAYTAWQSDITAGKDAVLLAPTRELVTQLNERARTDRLAAITTAANRAAVVLHDGTHASAGDTIITQQNSRRLMITATDWVKNGDRWSVESVDPKGALRVRHLRTSRRITLPRKYVREHVALGYAATIHAAQGLSVEASHTVSGGDDLVRQLLYVALSRGSSSNHLYLSIAGDGNEHTAITRDALLPPTAADILLRILARDGAQISATTTARKLADPRVRLHSAARRYHDSVMAAAEDLLGTAGLEHLDAAAEQALPGLTAAPAWPTLRSNLALHSLDNTDPSQLLADTIAMRELATAEDPAAVLDWRLDPTRRRSAGTGPLPWLPATPAALDRHDTWGAYLRARARLIDQTITNVADTVTGWTASNAPAWAAPLLGITGESSPLLVDLTLWRAAQGLEDTEPRPAGPRPPTAAEARYHQDLQRRIEKILGNANAPAERWRPTVAQVAPTVPQDPFWSQLAARLETAARAGVAISAVLDAATMTQRPLPDEHPASALWWRLTREMPHAVLETVGDCGSAMHLPHPDWIDCLTQVLGTELGYRVMSDPTSPMLATAVDDATRCGWRPRQILSLAYENLRERPLGQCLDEDEPRGVRAADLATDLTWQVRRLLTLPSGVGPDEQESAQTIDEEAPLIGDELPPAPRDEHLAHEPEPVEPVIVQAPMPTSVPAARATASPPPTTPARPAVDVARIAELNAAAMDYFTARVPTSWVPAYLDNRLGPDIAATMTGRSPAPGPFTAGYAPVGWNSLLTHLRAGGATDNELLASGLASRASTGRLIDRFRDRLILPILDTNSTGEPRIVGFVGRRNPSHDGDPSGKRGDVDRHGPKYLNTSTTDLFNKGNVLFGLVEAGHALASGATPVHVEGPLDAIAVTAAGAGQYVGVAPLGTAFTDAQADLLLSHAGPYPHLEAAEAGSNEERFGLLVATDPDAAGQAAAERSYWLLADRDRDDVGYVHLPEGIDPAQLLAQHGAAAVREALDTATALPERLIDMRIQLRRDDLHTVEGRVQTLRLAAEVIASRHPSVWMAGIEILTTRLDLLPETVMREVLAETITWGERPRAAIDVSSAPTVLAPQPRDESRPSTEIPHPSRRTPSAGHPTSSSQIQHAPPPPATDARAWSVPRH